jgi:hypothetical protein
MEAAYSPKCCAIAVVSLISPEVWKVITYFDVGLYIAWRHPVELGNTFYCAEQYLAWRTLVQGNNIVRYMYLNNTFPHLFHRPLSSQHLPHPASIPISNYLHFHPPHAICAWGKPTTRAHIDFYSIQYSLQCGHEIIAQSSLFVV